MGIMNSRFYWLPNFGTATLKAAKHTRFCKGDFLGFGHELFGVPVIKSKLKRTESNNMNRQNTGEAIRI